MTRPKVSYDYTVLDCPDPYALSSFYRDLLGWTVTYDDDDQDWVVLSGSGGLRLAFQRASDFVPVDWPSEGVRSHIDFVVDDLDEGEQFALSLGARRLREPVPEPGFRAFADPVGHVFCLCRPAPMHASSAASE